MSIHQVPVLECAYGWGQKAKLYQDRLEANGTVYILSDLTYIEPIHLRLMGISAIRLRLFFKYRLVVLRGLTHSEPVQEMIVHLTRLLSASTDSLIDLSENPGYKEDQPVSQRSFMVSSQGSFWDYHEEETNHFDKHIDSTATGPLELYRQLILPEIVYLPEDLEYRFAYQRIRQGQIPCIDIPLRLLPGEIAHYRTNATLCDEPTDAIGPDEAEKCYPSKYRIKDRGSFILTNSRILYLGRKRHMLFGYGQLLYISHWRDFVALAVKNFQKRYLFEMHHRSECMIYLEALLQRYWAAHQVETWNMSCVSSPSLSISARWPLSIRARALARTSNAVS